MVLSCLLRLNHNRSVEGQIGWGFGKPYLAKDVPVYGRRAKTRSASKVPSNTNCYMIINKTPSISFISVQKGLQNLDNTTRFFFFCYALCEEVSYSFCFEYAVWCFYLIHPVLLLNRDSCSLLALI